MRVEATTGFIYNTPENTTKQVSKGQCFDVSDEIGHQLIIQRQVRQIGPGPTDRKVVVPSKQKGDIDD